MYRKQVHFPHPGAKRVIAFRSFAVHVTPFREPVRTVKGPCGIFKSMKDYAAAFYSSQAWRDCREAYRKQARGLCEICLKKGIYKSGDIVHHIKHITPANINNPEITLSFENLELVCRDCHADLHRTGGAKRYKVDACGRILT